MLAVKGVYENGKVSLKEKINTAKPVNVVVTFLEDVEATPSEKLDLQKFLFRRAKELLKDYKGSLSDAVIEERRSAKRSYCIF
jgi:hypothetical protein